MSAEETRRPVSGLRETALPSDGPPAVSRPGRTASEIGGLARSIGARLREARKASGLTLDELAAGTGFTKGYLSKVETGRSAPPIGTLARISQALNTEVANFLQEAVPVPEPDATGVSVVRADERIEAIRGGSSFGYDYQVLARNLSHRHMEPFIFTYPAQVLKELFFEHEGEEMVFVLSGTVEMQVDSETYRLTAGDCIYFNSSRPHRGRGVNGEAKALVVIYNADRKVSGAG